MLLVEHLTWDQARIRRTEEEASSGNRKRLFLRGIMLQGNVRNCNNRVYPAEEIRRAVEAIRDAIRRGESILGEADHPQEMKIHLDRVSHVIEDMWMEGDNGCGKLRILDGTPMGNLCRALLDNDIKLGVSSRGDGDLEWDVALGCYRVKDFRIQTVDIVARPSAPNAYPEKLYEAARWRTPAEAFDGRRGSVVEDLAMAACHDPRAREYLRREVRRWIEEAFR